MPPKSKRTRTRRRATQALPILAGVLMASGLVRMGDGSANAIIEGFSTIAANAATASEPTGGEPAEDGISTILAALKQREEQLDQRETRLAEREVRLARLEDDLRGQMDELAQAEDDLKGLLKMAETAADDDLSRLTSVYESMSPKEAAALFSEMSPMFAAGFLGRMRPEAAAAVMAGLDPATAYSISVMIAGRNAELASNE